MRTRLVAPLVLAVIAGCGEPSTPSSGARPTSVATGAAPAQRPGHPTSPASAAAAPASAPAPAGRVLEVWRIDDAVDPLHAVKEADVPDGVELRVEAVPAGDPNRPAKVAYAYARLQSGETPEAAAQRLRTWAATVARPFGTQFLVAPVGAGPDRADAGAAANIVTGFRTYLAREPVVFDDRDVTEAHVELADRPVARVTVGDAGGARFEQATKEWTARRIAIVAFGQVVAAPLVMAPITSKKASIPAQGATDADRRAYAERVVAALTGR